VVLPLADLLLGTLVLNDPQPARITEPAAKTVARRHSLWGKRLREEAAGVNGHASSREPADSLVSPPES